MDIFKKVLNRIKEAWSQWAVLQKGIAVFLAVALLGGIIGLTAVSSTPDIVPLFSVPIQDQVAHNRIMLRLDRENIRTKTDSSGRIFVADEKVAMTMRALLFQENLVPKDLDPWAFFDVDRWTLTDVERNIQIQKALTERLRQHIVALDDIDDAQVSINIPEKTLFAEAQNPTTAYVTVTPKPGSDFKVNQTKVKSLEKMVQFAVEGLTAENIIILDNNSNQLNDFEGLERVSNIELGKKIRKEKTAWEIGYTNRIAEGLETIFKDRFQIINIDVDFEVVDKTVDQKDVLPVVIKENNPATPYDDSQILEKVPISQFEYREGFRGTGYHPEGPPGMEGQTPPQYKDLQEQWGVYDKTQDYTNFATGERTVTERANPYNIKRVSVAVALDGKWGFLRDEEGDLQFINNALLREYTPVSGDELSSAKKLISSAINFDIARGDSVSVEHVPFDRSEQHNGEDEAYARKLFIQQMIRYSILGLIALIAVGILARLIHKYFENKRLLREEELAREHQAMREAALRRSEEEALNMDISIQDRASVELLENVTSIAREHPQEAALLIRTWLAEEDSNG